MVEIPERVVNRWMVMIATYPTPSTKQQKQITELELGERKKRSIGKLLALGEK